VKRPSVRTVPAHAVPASAGTGRNPLLIEADALLALAPQLRATPSMQDLNRLRSRIVEMLREFEARALARSIGSVRIARARTVLGALIDEVIQSMPWGAGAGWQSLAVVSAERSGRVHIAAPVEHLLEVSAQSSRDRELQELIWVALALGFDSCPRASESERDPLERIRARLAPPRPDRRLHGRGELSPHWRPAVSRGSALGSWLPLWVSTAVAAGLLAALYFSLALLLGASSDRVYSRIASLRSASAQPSAPAPAAPARLALWLEGASAQGRLVVRDEIDRSVIVLPGRDLFDPDAASLRASAGATLREVAAALHRTVGRVEVIGHTDGTAARSLRYPSEWDLSVERARVVGRALQAFGLEAARVRFDGRADSEPLAVNDIARLRSGNDRVEILLLAGR
jgi:type VI secretion system protein ImpK